jgi:hypothetical protein
MASSIQHPASGTNPGSSRHPIRQEKQNAGS